MPTTPGPAPNGSRLWRSRRPRGTGEAHPFLSPDDAFADFELIDKGNLSGSEARTKDMLQHEYAREALKNGLKHAQVGTREGLRLARELGANPLKFGLIGSTDAETALPTTREETHFSKTTSSSFDKTPSARRSETSQAPQRSEIPP